MELKEFIVETLSNIIDATIETQNKYVPGVKNTNPVINPRIKTKDPTITKAEIPIEKIHFDLSVVETKNTEGKIIVSVLGLGSTKEVESLQKVSFDIPLYLPTFSQSQKE